MKISTTMRKNVSWLIAASICSVIISCGVVLGTSAVAEQIDLLITESTTEIIRMVYIVIPAIIIATAASFIRGKVYNI